MAMLPVAKTRHMALEVAALLEVALEVAPLPAAKSRHMVLEVAAPLEVVLPPVVVPLRALLEVALLLAVAGLPAEAPLPAIPEVLELLVEELPLREALAVATLPALVQADLQGSAEVTSFLYPSTAFGAKRQNLETLERQVNCLVAPGVGEEVPSVVAVSEVTLHGPDHHGANRYVAKVTPVARDSSLPGIQTPVIVQLSTPK